MTPQINRGRTMLRLLLGAVCGMFLVNIFYPLYLSPPGYTNRIMASAVMIALAVLALNGARNTRGIICGVLFILAALDVLVLFSAVAAHNWRSTAIIGSIAFVFMLVGWSLLKSPSVRAWETARHQEALKI